MGGRIHHPDHKSLSTDCRLLCQSCTYLHCHANTFSQDRFEDRPKQNLERFWSLQHTANSHASFSCTSSRMLCMLVKRHALIHTYHPQHGPGIKVHAAAHAMYAYIYVSQQCVKHAACRSVTYRPHCKGFLHLPEGKCLSCTEYSQESKHLQQQGCNLASMA